MSVCFVHCILLLFFSAVHEQHSLVTPKHSRNAEAAERAAELPAGYGREELVHGDGGDEARGCFSHPDHKKLHYS